MATSERVDKYIAEHGGNWQDSFEVALGRIVELEAENVKLNEHIDKGVEIINGGFCESEDEAAFAAWRGRLERWLTAFD